MQFVTAAEGNPLLRQASDKRRALVAGRDEATRHRAAAPLSTSAVIAKNAAASPCPLPTRLGSGAARGSAAVTAFGTTRQPRKVSHTGRGSLQKAYQPPDPRRESGAAAAPRRSTAARDAPFGAFKRPDGRPASARPPKRAAVILQAGGGAAAATGGGPAAAASSAVAAAAGASPSGATPRRSDSARAVFATEYRAHLQRVLLIQPKGGPASNGRANCVACSRRLGPGGPRREKHPTGFGCPGCSFPGYCCTLCGECFQSHLVLLTTDTHRPHVDDWTVERAREVNGPSDGWEAAKGWGMDPDVTV